MLVIMIGIGPKCNVTFFLVFLSSAVYSQHHKHINERQSVKNDIPNEFVYKGIALEVEGMHIWGASPILDTNGRTHLYVSQWPISKENPQDFSGWYKESQIAHYVSDSPEGPFELVGIAVPDMNGVFNSPHNPTVKYYDGKYVLCFIVNEFNNPQKQRIVMYVSNDLSDNWEPASRADPDGTILRQSNNNSIWSSKSFRGVTNPTLLKFKDTYLLYYKGVLCDENKRTDFSKWFFGYGVAYSKKLEGPYIFHDKMVTPNTIQIEDAYAYQFQDKIILIGRDIRGHYGSSGGGLTMSSTDGFTFYKSDSYHSYNNLSSYIGFNKMKEYVLYRGDSKGNLERPQFLFKNNTPIYLYMATGLGKSTKFGSTSHVFRLN
ncbi:MAG: glycoside hydrolase family protein [Jejuia sp.]